MPEYDIGPSDSDYEGCLIAIEVVFEEKGELEREKLEKIDKVMENLGSQSTGKRMDINSAGKANTSVKYVYQERLMAKSLKNAKERLQEPFGKLEKEPSLFIGTEVVELK